MSVSLESTPQRESRWRGIAAGIGRVRLTRFQSGVLWATILLIVNLLAATGRRDIDLTSGRKQSLSPETRALLRQLEQPVEIAVISPVQPRTVGERAFAHAAAPFRDLMERCRNESRWIQWRVLDPEMDLAARRLTEEFPDLATPGILITTESQGIRRHETLQVRDIAEIGMNRDRQPVIEFFGEQALAGALARLIDGVESTKIYCLTGHGELVIEDEQTDSRRGMGLLGEKLRAMGCRIEALDLTAVSRVPQDADLVILAGPVAPLKPAEIERLRRYLGQGGRGLVLVEGNSDPKSASSAEETLGGLLAEYGVAPGADRLVTAGFTGEIELASPVMPATADHPLVRSLPLSPLVLYDARSIRERVGVEATTTLTIPLLVSHPAPRAWGETDQTALEAAFDPRSDLPGPVCVACAVERRQGDLHEPVLVVVGDSEFVSNRNLSTADGRTAVNFLCASLRWLRGEQNFFANIPSQRRAAYQLTGTPAELQRTVWGSAFVLCAGLLAAAATTWVQRRS